MHDPMVVAFEIRRPWRDRPSKFWPKGYRPSLITVWHVDPETDGTDDSCGWFARARHVDQDKLEKVREEFEFNWDSDHSGWFDDMGTPRISTLAIGMDMFSIAARVYFGSFDAAQPYLRHNVWDILHFCENRVDSIEPTITKRYGHDREREDLIRSMAACVYTYVHRANLPWYRHPRWHWWHWSFQVHPWQRLRRWLFDRCCHCGGRFAYGYSPVSHQWHSKPAKFMRPKEGLYHAECSTESLGQSGRLAGFQ